MIALDPLVLIAITSTKWTALKVWSNVHMYKPALCTLEVNVIHPHFSNKEIESYSLAGKKGFKSRSSKFKFKLHCPATLELFCLNAQVFKLLCRILQMSTRCHCMMRTQYRLVCTWEVCTFISQFLIRRKMLTCVWLLPKSSCRRNCLLA